LPTVRRPSEPADWGRRSIRRFVLGGQYGLACLHQRQKNASRRFLNGSRRSASTCEPPKPLGEYSYRGDRPEGQRDALRQAIACSPASWAAEYQRRILPLALLDQVKPGQRQCWLAPRRPRRDVAAFKSCRKLHGSADLRVYSQVDAGRVRRGRDELPLRRGEIEFRHAGPSSNIALLLLGGLIRRAFFDRGTCDGLQSRGRRDQAGTIRAVNEVASWCANWGAVVAAGGDRGNDGRG